jgi:hypothetical protein
MEEQRGNALAPAPAFCVFILFQPLSEACSADI